MAIMQVFSVHYCEIHGDVFFHRSNGAFKCSENCNNCEEETLGRLLVSRGSYHFEPEPFYAGHFHGWQKSISNYLEDQNDGWNFLMFQSLLLHKAQGLI